MMLKKILDKYPMSLIGVTFILCLAGITLIIGNGEGLRYPVSDQFVITSAKEEILRRIDENRAGIVQYRERCIDGVTYLTYVLHITVKLGTDSKVIICENSDEQ